MTQEFNFKSKLKDIQTRLVSQSIRDTAHTDFLKSEESIAEVIKSYQERFQSTGDMLFDAAEYVAESTDIIKVEDFNEMFESIFIDLSALYGDLELVDQVLKLNLNRNKNYFLVIKKRLRDLWNKLHLTRLLVYDESPSDESYYESFYTNINAKRLSNISVDKKSGFLHLSPDYARTHNISSVIKNVTSTTYPEHNDNGGVRFTTNNLNSFVENYTNGLRDMLANGLWKEQVLCNEIPDFNLNIGSADSPLYKTYKGIVSVVDIDFVYPVDINRVDFDVFGDLPTKIDSILYKSTSSSDWSSLTFENPYRIPLESEWGELTKSAKGTAFDVLSLTNITKIRAKHLRVVLNQENYTFLDSKDTEEPDVDKKIENDLAERRYELVKFGSDIDEFISKPISEENKSLYYRIIDIIESTRNVEEILNKIDDILNPKIDVVAYDYERTAKFEIGAWSIEPKIEAYSQRRGEFDSMSYTIPDKALTSVSLITNQYTPKASTASWYINIGDKDVPIVENNNTVRRETLYPFDASDYSNFDTWTGGTFFLLDCPISSTAYDDLYVSVDGGTFKHISSYGKIVYLNSRLIYIDAITTPFEAIYTIQYPVEINGAVNLYVLSPKPGPSSPKGAILDIVASREEVLKAVLSSNWKAVDDQNTGINDLFSISSAISTIEEAKLWFGEDFNSCVFVGDKLGDYFNVNIGSSPYSEIIGGGESKSSVTYSSARDYITGSSTTGLSDLELIGSLPNIAPLSKLRRI